MGTAKSYYHKLHFNRIIVKNANRNNIIYNIKEKLSKGDCKHKFIFLQPGGCRKINLSRN